MKLRLYILKVSAFDISNGTAVNATIDIQDTREYDTQEKLQALKQSIADVYQAQESDVMTELEYQYKLLEIAQDKRRTLEEMYDKQGTKNSKEIIGKVHLLDWKSNSNKELGNQKRKITKLLKAYTKQGLWHQELD